MNHPGGNRDADPGLDRTADRSGERRSGGDRRASSQRRLSAIRLGLLISLDVLCALGVLFAAIAWQQEVYPQWSLPNTSVSGAMLATITVLSALVLRQGRGWSAVTESTIARLVILGVVITLLWLVAEFLLNRGAELPRQMVARYGVGLPLALIAMHWLTATAARVLHLTTPPPLGAPTAVVLGRPGDARALVEYIQTLPGRGDLAILGVVTDEAVPLRTLALKEVLGAGQDLVRICERLAVERRLPPAVLLATRRDSLRPMTRLALEEAAAGRGLTVIDVAADLTRSFETVTRRRIARRREAPRSLRPPGGQMETVLRRALNFGLAAAGLVVAFIPMLVVALSVRLILGAPVLFRQERVGRHGEPIVVSKFRTMRFASTDGGDALPDDRRTNPFGAWLRATRLDELPQLWNILVGDLAFVGPRPLVADQVAALPDRGQLRGQVTPGLTGWAQIHGGQALSLEDKFIMDVWYVRHATLWLDLKILMLTALRLRRLERIDAAEAARCRAEVKAEIEDWLRDGTGG